MSKKKSDFILFFIHYNKQIPIWVLVTSLIVAVVSLLLNNRAIFTHVYFEERSDSSLVLHPIEISSHKVDNYAGESRRYNPCCSCISDTISVMPDEHVKEIDGLLSKIVSTTDNTITYFSFVLAAITLVATLGVVKYYKKYITVEDRIKELDNSILDAALMTVHAVPFVSATQINSIEHIKAINHISELVDSKKDVVEKTPKYVLLLLCQGLNHYFNQDYAEAIQVMEKAERLIRYQPTMKREVSIIHFYLAKTYKQYAFSKIPENQLDEKNFSYSKDITEIQNLLDKAEKHTKSAPKWMQKSLSMSIALIRDKFFEGDNFKKILEEDRYKNIRFDSFDQMTIAPLIVNKNTDNVSKVTPIGKVFLHYMKSHLADYSGANVRAAWYFSMARTCRMINEYDKATQYHNLTLCYLKECENIDVKTIFMFDYLSEVSIDYFRRQVDFFNPNAPKTYQ